VVDPVSLGIAAAILLATKYGEGLAQSAAAGSWSAIDRLRQRIAAKFRDDEPTSAAIARLASEPTDADREIVAARIEAASVDDDEFRSEVDELVALAREDRKVADFISNAYDNAKVLNMRDNRGSISF